MNAKISKIPYPQTRIEADALATRHFIKSVQTSGCFPYPLVVSSMEEWIFFRVYKHLPSRLLRNNPSRHVS